AAATTKAAATAAESTAAAEAAAARGPAAGAAAAAANEGDEESDDRRDRADRERAQNDPRGEAHNAADDAGAGQAAEDRAQHSAQKEDEDQAEEQHVAAGPVRRLPLRPRRRELLAFDEPHHAIGAGTNPAVEVALLEAGSDVLLDDAPHDGIGQDAFDAAPGDDPDAPVLFCHQEQHAVVDALAAELPGIEDAHAVLDRRLRLDGRHQQDGDLAAFARFELGERLLE